MVPVAVIELDEAHAALRQPAREQAVRGEGAVARLATVGVEDVLRLLRDVHQIRRTRLHPEGELVLRQPRRDLRIVDDLVAEPVEPAHGVDDGTLAGSLLDMATAVRNGVREIGMPASPDKVWNAIIEGVDASRKTR